jgi:Fur family ferric uptake transcriptional regulator|tara:strand:- start:242 stop:754 length:513 start_codon:yes stop_codon:yes gene_type:complete
VLEQTLKNNNIKPTTIRLLVLRKLIESETALSLSDLVENIEQADRATLYRTLKTFENKNLIHSIDDGSGSVKYGLCAVGCGYKLQDQHIHFHCMKCEETYCLTQTKIPRIQIPIGFETANANMVLKGTCANCSSTLQYSCITFIRIFAFNENHVLHIEFLLYGAGWASMC